MTTDTISVRDFRLRARTWLAENLERKPAAPTTTVRSAHRGMHDVTRAHIDAERPKQRRLYEAGFAGITWPVEYGGQGLSTEHERAFKEEAEPYQLPDFGIAAGTTFGVCAPVLLAHASDDFKRRHMPRILAGDELWAQFFSEPVAGSDLAGIQTRATRDGDSWIIGGAKVWSSWAHLCDWGLCLARTNWGVPKHRGLTWFGFPVDAPGVTMRVIRQIDGGADFCEEFLDGVVLSDIDRVGDVDEGWTVARTLLAFERSASARELSWPPEPGSIAPDLVEIASLSGRNMDPEARQLIARGHSLDFLSRVLQLRIAASVELHGPNTGIAAYAKLARGMFEAERALIGMQIGRGHAIAWDEPESSGAKTALAFLNGRVNAVAGGTDQMQRNAISEQVLGLPREPSWDRNKPFDQVLRDAARWDGTV